MTAHLAYYEVLGLDAPPADRKAVKRAYSKMLKVTRPEDDPDGFMRLRDAHDLALNIVADQAENAAWEAQQVAVETTNTPDTEPETATEPSPDTSSEPSPKSGLTYQDMLPEPAPEPASNTSYAIGPTPNFDAPVSFHAPPEPQAPPLIEDLNVILDDPKNYNDRERWNILFRKARQLDIDDYVDFEQLLLERILQFYEYYSPKMMDVKYPGSLPERINQSISASLFKTMSWDKISTLDPHKNMLLDWLARRMRVRHVTNMKSDLMPVPIPETNSGGNGKVWMFLIGFFILVKIIQALANA